MSKPECGYLNIFEDNDGRRYGDFLMRWLFAAFATITLAGCSSTPADLEAKSTATSQTYTEDYQEIYRRVSITAKRCFAQKVGLYASFAVDSVLSSELGYGQLTLSHINSGRQNYYISVRIEKQAAGSKLTMISDDTSASGRYKDLVLEWAAV
jgi:hypothetical protein